MRGITPLIAPIRRLINEATFRALCGVSYLIAQLPWRVLWRVAEGLGCLLSYSPRARITLANLALCFPETSTEVQKRIARECAANSVFAGFETMLAAYRPCAISKRILRVEGTHHIEALAKNGQGAILLNAHFTTMDAAAIVFGRPTITFYRPHDGAVINRWINHMRARFVAGNIAKNAPLKAIRAVRQGGFLNHLPDQRYGRPDKVQATFFGHRVDAAPLWQFAHLVRAPLVPTYCVREAGGYVLVFGAPWLDAVDAVDIAERGQKNNNAGDTHEQHADASLALHENGNIATTAHELAEETPQLSNPGQDANHANGHDAEHAAKTALSQRYFDWLEGVIRAYPAQYLWSHRRFSYQIDYHRLT